MLIFYIFLEYGLQGEAPDKAAKISGCSSSDSGWDGLGGCISFDEKVESELKKS